VRTVAWGFVSLALATLIGAFGAHAVKDKIPPASLAVFHTGQQYHVVVSFAVIGVGLLSLWQPELRLKGPVVALTLGCLLFSGSLYALALSGVRILGAVTPIGGVAIVGSYLWIALTAFRSGDSAGA
jgi:uncharacterized membrane protein YgdD (TMEM256/DUF423 family)